MDGDAHGTEVARVWKNHCSCIRFYDFLLLCCIYLVFLMPYRCWQNAFPLVDYWNILSLLSSLPQVCDGLFANGSLTRVALNGDLNMCFFFQIFSMTLRLSAMFEDRVKPILSSWRLVAKNKNALNISGSVISLDKKKLALCTFMKMYCYTGECKEWGEQGRQWDIVSYWINTVKKLFLFFLSSWSKSWISFCNFPLRWNGRW
jgi:hypothetical protein